MVLGKNNITPPKVAVCVDKSRNYGRGLLNGIAEYIETFGPWSLLLDPQALGNYSDRWIDDWKGDGVLAYIEDSSAARRLRENGIPVVELFGHQNDLGIPQVANDDVAIGRLAGEHFLERQFQNFAFTGYPDESWVARRLEGYQEAVRERNTVRIFYCPRNTDSLSEWDLMHHKLTVWLNDLPKPVGLMACSDRQAQRVLDACRQANLSVPEMIAVIGVDNDEETCRLSHPPLSSVQDNPRRIGFEAARMLDEQMRHKKHPQCPETCCIPPLGIVTRVSSDIVATDDVVVQRALRLIRDHFNKGWTAEQLASELGVSRSVLYRRFTVALNRTPHQELVRFRLEKVKTLLRQTDLTLEQISESTNFDHPEYLSVMFKRETGMTPREFRIDNARQLQEKSS